VSSKTSLILAPLSVDVPFELSPKRNNQAAKTPRTPSRTTPRVLRQAVRALFALRVVPETERRRKERTPLRRRRERRLSVGRDPGWLDEVVRAKRPQRLPVMLTRPEVEALLATLDGVS
jgi:hypothetical protein